MTSVRESSSLAGRLLQSKSYGRKLLNRISEEDTLYAVDMYMRVSRSGLRYRTKSCRLSSRLISRIVKQLRLTETVEC